MSSGSCSSGLCPPAHHNLLELKRQGFPLAEIAARTGLHESSVRRILYDLARRLAAARGEMASASRDWRVDTAHEPSPRHDLAGDR